MGFEWFISLRYLKAKRKQSFISLITIISVAGVAIGVMALIVVLGVMTGFTDEFRDKILGINSHIVVQKFGGTMDNYATLRPRLESHPGVKAATPFITSQVMMTAGAGGTGAILRGIDPETVSSVLDLAKHMVAGSLEDLDPQGEMDQAEMSGIVIGRELAQQLRVGLYDKIRLISSAGALTPMGVIPKMKTCRVVGIFKSGMYEYDSVLSFVSLKTAQTFLEIPEQIHGYELKLDDIYTANRIAGELEKKLGLAYVARDWMRTNKNIFSALQLEKTALSVIVALVVVVAAFNIVSTLIMVVMEKSKDIAILKSMGATSRSIMRIFIYEGLIIGVLGTVLGVIGGLGLGEILSRYEFIKLPDVYPISTLPVKIAASDVVIISIAAVLISFIATLYPSWQAARVDPAEALRYE